MLHSHCATQWLHGDGKKSCPLCKRPDTSSYPLYFELRALAGSSSQGDAVASSGDAARVVKLRVRVSELLADQMSVMGAKIALEQRCERGKHALLTEKHNAIKVRNLLKKKTRENDALRQQLEDSNAQRVGLEFVSAGLATGFADSDSRALVDRCRADNPESSAHVVKGVRVALDAVTRQYREEVKQRRKAAEETRRVRRKLENQRDDATELLTSEINL